MYLCIIYFPSVPNQVFGETVEWVCERESSPVPNIVQSCITKLEGDYTADVNIFEEDRAVNLNMYYELLVALNNGKKFDVSKMNAKTAAILLMQFVCKTYDPLFPVDEYKNIVAFRNWDDSKKTEFMKRMFALLQSKKPVHYSTLYALLGCLQKIKKSNGAAEFHLAKKFASCLVRRQNGYHTLNQLDADDSHEIAEFLRYCMKHVNMLTKPN